VLGVPKRTPRILLNTDEYPECVETTPRVFGLVISSRKPSKTLNVLVDNRRCLASLPDLGNPTVLSGLCWWKEYGVLLKDLGLLRYVRKENCTDIMAFGDGPSLPPLFVLL
jgi:hypothetical protein